MLNAKEWPYHRRIVSASTTQKWIDYDTEERFKQNCKDSAKLKKLTELGWLDTEIEYKYNKQGFRSIEFDTNLSAGLALGCSHTEGIGIRNEDVWVSVLSRAIDYPIYNLGVGASAMDTIYRIAEYWIPKLNPKFVVLACPNKHRIEICDYDGNFRTYFPQLDQTSSLYKEWIMNDLNADKNFSKNLLAISYICKQANIPLVYSDATRYVLCDAKARDLDHGGPETHYKFAQQMLEKMDGIL